VLLRGSLQRALDRRPAEQALRPSAQTLEVKR
jgi:hypothetical protein